MSCMVKVKGFSLNHLPQGLFSICQEMYRASQGHSKLRCIEGAVRGRQYGPHPSIQPEKRSFEGCLHGFVPYWRLGMYSELLFGFTIRIL